MFDEYTDRIHRDYLRSLSLKYEILEKSEPKLCGLPLSRLMNYPRGIARDICAEAIVLLSEISLHRLYFESFSEKGELYCQKQIEDRVGSLSSFIYDMKNASLKLRRGFVSIGRGRNGVEFRASEDFTEHFVEFFPLLTIDLCEHAYFVEYGFNTERYLDSMISHLRFSLIL